jgi:drug/metabolite transporter (DMT)-like permease
MSKEIRKPGFAFGKENYRILIIGVVIVVIGYLLMIGGGSDDPNQFHADEIFSTRRVTIAPIVILAGFVVVLYGIMKKSKE